MLECLRSLCFPRPESVSLLNETLAVQEWCQGFHITKSLTYQKVETIQTTRFSQIAKISFEGKEWVLKSANSEKRSKDLEQEVSLLKMLNAAEKGKSQKCVIDLLALLKVNDRPAMLLPLFQSDLFQRVQEEKGLSLQSTLKILDQMFKVLAFLKEQNVFHRDIKPENIFIVKDDEIRLADFGLAMRKGDVERSQMACGTIEYLSPELTKAYVTKSLESNPFDFPSDMWSTAYTVFLSASYRKPFVVDETPGWGKRLINEQKQFSGQLENRIGGIYKGNSKEESAAIALFETVLKRMFEVDPSRRLTPEVGLECIRGSEFP